MKQSLTFTNRIHLPLTAHPVRHGVPWPKGFLRENMPISARDENGASLPIATRILNRWPDGSIQWTLIDLSLDLSPSQKRIIEIHADPADVRPTPVHPVIVSETSNEIRAGNSLVDFSIPRAPGDSLVHGWIAGDLDVVITDNAGVEFSAAKCRTKKISIENFNPLRAVLRVEGKHESADGHTLLEFWVRFTICANRPDVTVTYHYHNLEKQEPGVTLRTMLLRLNTRLPADAERAIIHGFRGRATRPEPFRLREDFEICASNTMDLANYESTHRGLTGGGAGRVFIRQPELLRDDPLKRPWFLRSVVDFKFQSKDDPAAYVWAHLGLVSDRGSLVVAGANMVGLHPKSLAVRGNTVEYWIWPQWAGAMEITQGEGRTLDFRAALLPPRASDMDVLAMQLSWEVSGIYAHWGAQGPVQTSMDIDHVRKCRVFHVDKLPRYLPGERLAFERKVQAQWAPDGPVPANGHWHYGDVFARWDIGVNNEEMVGHVWFQEYLRSGRPACLEQAIAQTQHIADVDICAYSADPYQNGGMCAHGPRHNQCAAYPSHMWFTEMLYAYALTGDEEFKKAAVRVANNLVFWTQDDWGFDNLCADGRESGQPLINLTWVYEFVPDPRYLAAIWKIVRGSFMDRVKKHGSLIYMKPREDFALIQYASYGEWAAWEGLFYVWDLTRDEELRKFILSQLDWRLKEELMGTSGSFRNTDFNVAAYAYYLSGDRRWLDRVARPFSAVFRSVQWPFGYVKSMYFLHLAFEHGIAKDEQILLS